MQNIQVIYNIPYIIVGDILHFKTLIQLQNQGDVFYSNVMLKISSPKSPLKLYQNRTQFPI